MTEQALRRCWGRLVPRTIAGLAVVFACASALITTTLGIMTFMAVHDEIERQIDERIDLETGALLNRAESHGFGELVRMVNIRERRAMPGSIGYLARVDGAFEKSMGYMVFDRSGRRVAGAFAAAMPPPGWSEFVRFLRPDGRYGFAQAMNSAIPGGGRLVVAGNRANLDRMDALLFRLFAAAFGALLVLGGLAAITFGQIIRRRVAAIETSARAIIAGDITQRIPSDGSGVELDGLSMVLNQMLDRIGMLVDDVRQVSDGLAHDLRTPLSRLRVRLEEADRRAVGAEQRRLIEGAIADCDELLQLFSGILAIAEIDGRRLRQRFVIVDLGQALASIAEAHRATLEDAGKSLSVRAEPVLILGDRSLLQRIVANLLDNILHHAPTATAVTVAICRNGGHAIVRVVDDGPGVPLHEHARVFERLVRLDASRSKPGHGLGLSMVAAIASAHGGSVRIIPSARGTVVELVMPAIG